MASEPTNSTGCPGCAGRDRRIAELEARSWRIGRIDATADGFELPVI